MIIKLVLDIKCFASFVYLFIRESLSISTLRKIVIHILAFFFYAIFAMVLATTLVLFVKHASVNKLFHTVELDMAISNNNIYSFLAFDPRELLECELYMPENTCNFVKDKAQYVKFHMEKRIYELTIEASVIQDGNKKNFMYDFDMLSPDLSRNTKLQGMMMPKSTGIFHWAYKRFINDEEIFSSKTIITDFRFDNRPRVGVMAFKNIKDETFVTGIKVHIDIKTNFLIKLVNKYQFLAFTWLFIAIIWLMMLIYILIFMIVVVLQFLSFCEHVSAKHNRIKEYKHEERLIPRLLSVFFPILNGI